MKAGKRRIAPIVVFVALVLAVAGCATSVRIKTLKPAFTPNGKPIPPLKIEPAEEKFCVGEKLVYRISYLGIHVGEVVLWTKEITEEKDRDVYHYVLTARTNKFFSTIYKVNDALHSFVRADELLPRRFERYIRRRWRSSKLVVDYDQTNRQVTYFTGRDTWSRELSGDVQDPLSALYYFRSRELAVGKSIICQVSTGKKNYQVEARILSAGKLTLPRIGTYSAVLVEPRARENGVMMREGKAWLWISADSRRIPLVGKLRFALGTITACLERIETE